MTRSDKAHEIDMREKAEKEDAAKKWKLEDEEGRGEISRHQERTSKLNFKHTCHMSDINQYGAPAVFLTTSQKKNNIVIKRNQSRGIENKTAGATHAG